MQPTSLIWKMLEFYGTRVKHRGQWRVHAFLRDALHANANCNLEVRRQGLRWNLNPSDFVQTHLYWTGEYEGWDLLQLSRWVHPGAVVFDVGANFGYYSISLAAKMHGAGQIYAFEPCRATFARMQDNIRLNQFESIVRAIPCGLSGRQGGARLHQVDGNSGAASLSTRADGEVIELDTFDHFCEANAIRQLDLVKIDVEGSEVGVIEGGKAMLSLHQPVMMVEFNTVALEQSGTSIQYLEELLQGLGYRLFTAHREELVPFQKGSDAPAIRNVFCIPR